jgi:hypothetical protein
MAATVMVDVAIPVISVFVFPDIREQIVQNYLVRTALHGLMSHKPPTMRTIKLNVPIWAFATL